jgi:hypothetical protein
MHCKRHKKLNHQGLWHDDSHLLAKWTGESKQIISNAHQRLSIALKPHLSRRCMHIKGNYGVKGAMRLLYRVGGKYKYVARYDVNSYYKSIDHQVMLTLLKELKIDDELIDIVAQLLSVPDVGNTGKGMVAGSSLSPLLGAVYLNTLDHQLDSNRNIIYVRYMDDFVILAKTRWHLRQSINTTQRIVSKLKLRLHDKQKRFIGKLAKGFDFLGYQFYLSGKLQPSSVALGRLISRSARLKEQGASYEQLWTYVSRWHQWLHGGLKGYVVRRGVDWYMRLNAIKKICIQ